MFKKRVRVYTCILHSGYMYSLQQYDKLLLIMAIHLFFKHLVAPCNMCTATRSALSTFMISGLLHLRYTLHSGYLTISHRRRREYRRIVTETKSIFTEPKATNCFSKIALVIIRENLKKKQFATPKHQQIWSPF